MNLTKLGLNYNFVYLYDIVIERRQYRRIYFSSRAEVDFKRKEKGRKIKYTLSSTGLQDRTASTISSRSL